MALTLTKSPNKVAYQLINELFETWGATVKAETEAVLQNEYTGGTVNLGTYADEAALTTAHATANAGDYAHVLDTGTIWEWITAAWVDSTIPIESSVDVATIESVNHAVTSLQTTVSDLKNCMSLHEHSCSDNRIILSTMLNICESITDIIANGYDLAEYNRMVELTNNLKLYIEGFWKI